MRLRRNRRWECWRWKWRSTRGSWCAIVRGIRRDRWYWRRVHTHFARSALRTWTTAETESVPCAESSTAKAMFMISFCHDSCRVRMILYLCCIVLKYTLKFSHPLDWKALALDWWLQDFAEWQKFVVIKIGNPYGWIKTLKNQIKTKYKNIRIKFLRYFLSLKSSTSDCWSVS